jgi:hypothetical protein
LLRIDVHLDADGCSTAVDSAGGCCRLVLLVGLDLHFMVRVGLAVPVQVLLQVPLRVGLAVLVLVFLAVRLAHLGLLLGLALHGRLQCLLDEGHRDA